VPLRDTPIMSFINKLDREGRAPIELLDEVESVLGIQPVRRSPGRSAWARASRASITCFSTGEVHLFEPGKNFTRQDSTIFKGSLDPALRGLAHRRGSLERAAR
jgi:peptide chain release factor 3